MSLGSALLEDARELQFEAFSIFQRNTAVVQIHTANAFVFYQASPLITSSLVTNHLFIMLLLLFLDKVVAA